MANEGPVLVHYNKYSRRFAADTETHKAMITIGVDPGEHVIYSIDSWLIYQEKKLVAGNYRIFYSSPTAPADQVKPRGILTDRDDKRRAKVTEMKRAKHGLSKPKTTKKESEEVKKRNHYLAVAEYLDGDDE